MMLWDVWVWCEGPESDGWGRRIEIGKSASLERMEEGRNSSGNARDASETCEFNYDFASYSPLLDVFHQPCGIRRTSIMPHGTGIRCVPGRRGWIHGIPQL